MDENVLPPLNAAGPVLTLDEQAMLAEAEESYARGEYVPWSELRAWMLSWGTEHELPRPPVRSRPR